MNSRAWRVILPIGLFLLLVVGTLEAPFAAPRLFPRLFWDEHLGRAERRLVRAEREFKEADEAYNRLRASESSQPEQRDELRRAEALRRFKLEFLLMIKEKREQLEGESRAGGSRE
ncbi:MAG: hypothetical protein V1816_23260 [Pseudomonadota bacterium]